MMTGGSVSVSVLTYSKPTPTKPKPVVIVPPAGTLILQGDLTWVTSDGFDPASCGDAIEGAPTIAPGSSGFALVLYQARLIAQLQQVSVWPLPSIGQKSTPFSPSAPANQAVVAMFQQQVAAISKGVAAQANVDGPTFVTYFTANAQINPGSLAAVVSTTASVGAIPFAIATGEPIAPPGTPVDLPLTGSGTIS